MAKKYLGESIDIHAGGEDLIFPHHENEIAQSEAANGVQFSKYWMHNAFLKINNVKMSKSLGNFFTVRDIAAKYNLQVLRFFMLSAHYRNPLNFSEELMESAKNSLERITTAAGNLNHMIENAQDREVSEEEKNILAQLDGMIKQFENAMDDDFNTADAITAIFDMVKLANTSCKSSDSKKFLQEVLDKIAGTCGILGLEVVSEKELLDEDIDNLIQERQQARKDRNFARADEIRQLLLDKGIVLEDTREGVRWKRS